MLDLKGKEYEHMRPAIDKARVVKGLEELDVSGRRRRVEEGGHCWFCNARGGCQTCGADMIVPIKEDQHTGYAAPKRGRKEPEADEAHESNRAGKRVKRENTATPQGRFRASARPTIPAWSSAPNTMYLESQASSPPYPDPGLSGWSATASQAGNFVEGSSPSERNFGLPNPSRKRPLHSISLYTGEHPSQGSPPQNFMSSPPSGQAYRMQAIAPGNFQGDDGWHNEDIHPDMNQGQGFRSLRPEMQFLDPQLFENNEQAEEREREREREREQEQGDNDVRIHPRSFDGNPDKIQYHGYVSQTTASPQHEFANPRMNSARN